MVALQKTAQNWGFVPCYFDLKSHIIHVPDTDSDGLPDFIREDDESGLSRFFVLQTSNGLPKNISQAIKLGVHPDGLLLSDIADWYYREVIDKRHLFEVRIEFLPK